MLSDLVYLGKGIALPFNYQEFQYNLNFTFIFLLSCMFHLFMLLFLWFIFWRFLACCLVQNS